MPIFEYACGNCRTKIEKIVLAKVKASTVPIEIVERCKKCAAKTRHHKVVSAPAYVGLTPPATSQKATRMAEMRPARDKNWKKRVKQGINPEGKPLTNLRSVAREEWMPVIEQAYPDHEEKKKEVQERSRLGEFKSISEGLEAGI